MENFGVFVHVHNMGPYAVEILLKHSMDIGPQMKKYNCYLTEASYLVTRRSHMCSDNFISRFAIAKWSFHSVWLILRESTDCGYETVTA